MYVRHNLSQDFAYPNLIAGVDVRVDEAHSYRLHAALFQYTCHAPHFFFVKRLNYLTCRIDTFLDRQPVAAGDVRFGDVLVSVPQVFLVRAAYFHNVAKTFGADHRRARQFARDQRIRGDRGPVREQRHLGQIYVRLRNAGHDGAHGIIRRRRCLFNPDFTGLFVHDANICKGTANIHRYSCRCHMSFLI